MLRRTVPAVLLVTALLAAGAPPANALYARTYLTEWEGEPFLEAVDPLERFVHYPVVDANADGYAELAPTVYTDPAVETIDLSYLTNAAIEAEMALLGVTRADVAAQIDRALTPEPEMHDERDAAIASALAGDFLGVNTGLTNTALDIAFYCGTPSNPGAHDWVIGVPLPADCPSSNVGADMLFFATATHVELFGTQADDIDLLLEIKSLNGGYNDRYLGVKYGVHIIGTETSPQKHIRGDVKLDNLRNGPVNVAAALTLAQGSWVRDDTLVYTYGPTPFGGKTIWLDFAGTTTSFSLTAVVTFTGGFSVKLTLGSLGAIAEIRANLDLGSSGRKVSLAAKGFPSSFKIAFTKKSVSGGTQSEWYWIDLEHGNGVTAMANLEIVGTYSDSTGAQFSFQLVGFPAKNRLRVSPGNGHPGCDSLAVFSIDLSKRASTTAGRYRAISVTGHKCDKDVSLTGSNLHRVNLVVSKKDRWENDNEVMVSNGASVWVAADSKLDIFSRLPWILPNYESQLRNNPWGVTWFDRVGTFADSGSGPGTGSAILHDRPLTVNSYFWNVADNQLDSEVSCLFKYPAPDNRCA